MFANRGGKLFYRLESKFVRKLLFVGLLVLVVLSYFYIPSSDLKRSVPRTYYATEFDFKSFCCPTDGSVDVCGRPECSYPCPEAVDVIQTGDFPGNDVFFLETMGRESLTDRQACAVESMARHNTNLTVHVLTVGATNHSAPAMQALLEYGNVHVQHIQLADYFLGSRLEQWYFCGDWRTGPFAWSHLSDALRFLTLAKYGGYYFDTDFVILDSVQALRNFVVPEDDHAFAAGAFHFKPGHPVLDLLLEEFRTTYRKSDWGYNGPGVVLRVMTRLCQQMNVAEMIGDTCRGVSVLEPHRFYPVPWPQWRQLFENDSRVLKLAAQWRRRGVLGAHAWNNLSRMRRVNKNSRQIYGWLARTHCPHVYALGDDTF